MKRKRKGIQKFRSLKAQLNEQGKLRFNEYWQLKEKNTLINCQKIHIGALRDFILRCYQETHEIDVTYSLPYIKYLTEVLNIDINIPHDNPATILAPAQYLFWKRQKMSDDFRNMANQVNNFGCGFIPTNEDEI